ncbi:aspartyl-phosphate phosphatase Spo0E family protein [Halalkalibacter krulwichiae]|uniref:Aspartyl-phosphate phosphatase YisI n=1 Tax=Halalkalibacter krulwichiae TaxID=199441 RepID=A0A1X9MAE6_9BACI|nr:aspartyl-phosphate phosphatase Spo0E family protein [Halalkalibacter krulwichiae]ARK30395.1 Aspartyl-phosphate phosphatase YisI [Halalkalibacter krulwichiae]
MLCVEIEQKRLEMLKSAKKYGMTAEVTVQCSQELDKLLNLIQITPLKK